MDEPDRPLVPPRDEPDDLVLPDTLDARHADLLREHGFEAAGTLAQALSTDTYDLARVIYAIVNPEATAIVYIGGTEGGRDVRVRLRTHLRDRAKIGHVEKESLLFVHVMLTEYVVLHHFESDTGRLPVCNKRKAGFY